MGLLFSFSGRIGRLPYWGVSILLGFLYLGLRWLIPESVVTDPNAQIGIPTLLVALVALVVLIWISLAIMVKRFHDRDKSGLWVLIMFVPVIGALWILIELGFLGGTEGPNDYGLE
jgi:uncharacterized membrane protein YhaH (DUF805 family)